jgi:glycerophosphoryl diester phosphodiesterase
MEHPSRENGPYRTEIAAHRGGGDLWPENSPTAFRNVTRLPVDYVEFDVHPTSDGHLVVHHDAMLGRVTDGEGAILDKTWDEVSRSIIKGTDGERPPLLEEVIDIFAPTDIKLRLEFKNNADQDLYVGLERPVAETLQRTAMLERTVVTSFYIGHLTTFLSIAKPQGCIWLVKPVTLNACGGLDTILGIARDKGIVDIALHATVLNESAVAAARASGIRMGGYAANDEAAIRRMLELRVSMFTSDRPDLAVTLRDEIQGAAGSTL